MAHKKFAKTKIQRYYILSTYSKQYNEIEEMNELIDEIGEKHGCQVVVNGVIATIKYYLRLLKNTDDFLSNYTKNIQDNSEITSEINLFSLFCHYFQHSQQK